MLQGKVAIVTGAGRGIGKEIAHTLAKYGAAVVINDINEADAKAACDEFAREGLQAHSSVGDMGDETYIAQLAEEAIATYGKIDILVNNAGIVQTGGLLEIDPAAWDRTMRINVRSVFLACKQVVPHMVENQYGKIINIASVAGKRGGGLLGNSCYSASKGAVIAFTKSIAREVGKYHITVNAVCPALTETKMTDILDADKKKAIISMMPMGRAGVPQDIANGVLFLASPLSDFMTGEIMDVDGGLMMD